MTPLTQATIDSYDPTGTPEIYTNTDPYVRNENSICPGVDLTAVPVEGRGFLVTPDCLVRAEHNQASGGGLLRFVANDGTEHVRQQVAYSEKFGEDLALAKLDVPLPPSITPWEVTPHNIEKYAQGERLRSYRVTYASAYGHRLAYGDFSSNLEPPFSVHSRYDQDEIPGEADHWLPAIPGDSGGANFIVLDGKAVGIAATMNASSVGTPVSLVSTRYAILQFCPKLQFADWHLTEFNPTPPEIPGPPDFRKVSRRRK